MSRRSTFRSKVKGQGESQESELLDRSWLIVSKSHKVCDLFWISTFYFSDVSKNIENP